MKEKNFTGNKRKTLTGKMLKAFQNTSATFEIDLVRFVNLYTVFGVSRVWRICWFFGVFG